MVFDTFMFFNESLLTKVRLYEHAPFVDKFIIIEARQTHSGNPKPQNFRLEDYPEFAHKIEYRLVDLLDLKLRYPKLIFKSGNLETNYLHWSNEYIQRNYASVILQELGAQDSDLLLCSDTDEIISYEAFLKCVAALNEGKQCPKTGLPIVGPEQSIRKYKINLLTHHRGKSINILPCSIAKTINLSLIREYSLGFIVMEGGWHFSYLSATNDNVLLKMKSFSHAYQHQDVQTADVATSLILEGVIKVLPIDGNYPKYILTHLDEFTNYIWPENQPWR